MKNKKTLRIALCGRPNVGKSSLFNRLSGRKKSLVLDEPGVTRDVVRAPIEITGHKMELCDLAGLELWGDKGSSRVEKDIHHKKNQKEALRKLSIEAGIQALSEADLVLFVVDGRADLTPADEDLAKLVRQKNKKILLVISKVEGNVGEHAQIEASRLAFGEGILTSAEHNLGIEELREQILSTLDLEPIHPTEDDDRAEDETDEVESDSKKHREVVQLGVYGRPNVGKSTLVNQLLGERRMITSPIAGTTVDAIDTEFEVRGQKFRILDTAGIRKKSKTEQGVEVLSVVQALKSIERVHVALFLIDGYEGVTDQDEKVAGELVKSGKPVIFVVNKWDLCKISKEKYADKIRETLGFMDFAPILFISAERGDGLDPLFDLISEILEQRHKLAPTPELNRLLEVLESQNNPNGIKIYYGSQTSKNPPTITLLVNEPKKVHFAYERFLKNELRTHYGWMGSPLRLLFKARKKSPSKYQRRNLRKY